MTLPKRALLSGEIFSNRLLIRPIARIDFQGYQQIFADSKTTQFAGGELTDKEIDFNFNNCLKALERQPIQYLTLAIVKKSTETMIGIATLIWQDGKNNRLELGVMINRHNQRKGYCIELLNRLLEHCFTVYLMDSVFSFTLLKNIPAQQVLKKIGFIESIEKPLANYSEKGTYLTMSKASFEQ